MFRNAVLAVLLVLCAPAGSQERKPAPGEGAPLVASAGALAPFYDKLRLLAAGKLDRVSILHVGDSHVQGEEWTGPIRAALQRRFGAAGRGLIVPLDVAGTSGAIDQESASTSRWFGCRVVSDDPPVPIGVGGITTWTGDSGFMLKLAVSPVAGVPASFDRITALAECGPSMGGLVAADHPDLKVLEHGSPETVVEHHRVEKGDTLWALSHDWECTVRDIQKWNHLGTSNLIKIGMKLERRRKSRKHVAVDRSGFRMLTRLSGSGDAAGPCVLAANLPAPADHVFLLGEGPGGARLYGLILERRGVPGLLYHTAGVNGAQYHHFDVAKEFWRQVPVLHPDLVVASLGTNETLDRHFRPEAFRGEVEDFLAQVRAALGPVPVLLVAPPDHDGGDRRLAGMEEAARDVLAGLTRDHDLGFWDAAAAMGGPGSIHAWRSRGYAGPDLIHLTRSGYRALGGRFVDALLRAGGFDSGGPEAAAAGG